MFKEVMSGLGAEGREKVKEERGGKAASARQQQAQRPECCGEEAPEGAAAGGVGAKGCGLEQW